MYFSAKEILAQLEGTDKRICDLVIQNETELFETPYDKIMEMLEERYQIMYNSAHDALEKEIRSLSGLTGGSARKMWDYYKKGSMICDGTIIRGAAYALSCLEVNASMGLIVAAPTAGACGVLPAVLVPLYQMGRATEEEILQALYTASGIGAVVSFRACIAGASGGCQAEIGTASAMAAGALTSLRGGDPQQIGHAAAMALKNLMGLVCDPVAGLVEVPCVKRNVVGSVNAVSCADMALAGVESRIPVDEVIDCMGEVGRRMPMEMRETALGGLAATPTGKAVKERMEQQD